MVYEGCNETLPMFTLNIMFVLHVYLLDMQFPVLGSTNESSLQTHVFVSVEHSILSPLQSLATEQFVPKHCTGIKQCLMSVSYL